MTSKALVATALALLVGSAITLAVYLNQGEDPSPAGMRSPPEAFSDPFASLERQAALTAETPNVIRRPDVPTDGADPLPDPDIPAAPPAGPDLPEKRPAPETDKDAKDPVPPRGLAVVEATLCRTVDRGNRKPVGASETFQVRDGRIWCFMKLTGGANRKVRAVWFLGGRSHPGIWLKAGAPGIAAWRTWAYKNIDATLAGPGRVEIVDENSTVLLTLPVRITP